MTDEKQDVDIDEAATVDEEQPQYGVGPFSIREVALAGTWLVAFVVSFFPIIGAIGQGPSVWGSGIDWVLTVAVPTVAVFLVVLRRLSPQGIRRVGSLAIDQFASVAFSVSTVLWLGMLWHSFITLADQGFFLATWVVWVEFFLMLAGVVLTVFAPFIGPFAQDFRGRPEVPAHRAARPVRPVSPRPPMPVSEGTDAAAPADAVDATPGTPDATETTVITPYSADETVVLDAAETETEAEAVDTEPTAAESRTDESTDSAGDQAAEEAREPERTADAAAPAAASAAGPHQAFWALAPEERDIVDEIGIPVFRIGPSAWALVIEDRGEVFVVRHEDGRIGYLHDVSGVTRG